MICGPATGARESSVPVRLWICYNGRMQVWTVSQVTEKVLGLISSDTSLADLWVAGQISSLHRAASGHWYFTLVDGESELRSVMWRGLAGRVSRMPSRGDLVDAHGYVGVYERGGYYQFYVDTLEPAGIGTLWEEFARLRARLEAEGLFDAARKRPLPEHPRRIGVVTSPTGAPLQDILKVLASRYRLAEVVLSPTLVQGQEAPDGIARAIARLNRLADVDVVIVARGGGSLEDLMPFNDERVARAIAGARAPVVTGVGHETDITIADLVSDVRAPTPTAAAALVVPDGTQLSADIAQARLRLVEAMRRRTGELRRDLAQQMRLLQTAHPRRALVEKRQRLDDRAERMAYAMRSRLGTQRAALAATAQRLRALDARQIMGRGFALVLVEKTGERLSSVLQVHPDDQLSIQVTDGSVAARVCQVSTPRSTSGSPAC